MRADCATDVDATSLAYAIAAVPGSVFQKRFENAGGSLSKSADLLLSQLQARLQPGGGQGVRLDFLAFRLELHVEQSLLTAWALADGGPVNARHALQAALLVSGTTSSSAFQELSTLLEGLAVTAPSNKLPSRDVLKAFPVGEDLAKCYEASEPLLQETSDRSLWGRDFITLALLADDQSLDAISEAVGKSLVALRNAWFAFVVTSDTRHRSPDLWTRWWHAVGVALPPSGPGRSSTRLLAWDPARYPFAGLEGAAREIAASGATTMGWSVGPEVSDGDRVFLMRRHNEPLGLVGSGRVAGEPSERPHWDKAEAEKGRTYRNAPVEWDMLQELPLVALEDLIARTGEQNLWTETGTGLAIPTPVAERLEIVWSEAREGGAPSLGTEATRPRSYISSDAVSPGFGRIDFKPSEHDSLDAKTQAEIFAALMVAEEVQLPFHWLSSATGALARRSSCASSRRVSIPSRAVALARGHRARCRAPRRSSLMPGTMWTPISGRAWPHISSTACPRSSALGGTRSKRRVGACDARSIPASESKRKPRRRSRKRRSRGRMRPRSSRRSRRSATDRSRSTISYRLARVWNAVLAVKPDDKHKDWPDVAKLKDDAERIAARLGITNAIESAEEVQQTWSSMRDIYRRGGGLARALASDFTGNRLWMSSLVVLALLTLVLAWPWIVSAIDLSFFPALPDSLSELIAPVLQLGTVLIAAAKWTGSNTRSISSAMGYLERLPEELREPRVEPAAPSGKECELQDKIEKLDTEIATEQRQIEEADREISAAQAEISAHQRRRPRL